MYNKEGTENYAVYILRKDNHQVLGSLENLKEIRFVVGFEAENKWKLPIGRTMLVFDRNKGR